jgi:hypothetical protein
VNNYNGTLFRVYAVTAVASANDYNGTLFRVCQATAVASANDSNGTLFRVYPGEETRNFACMHFGCGKYKITTLKMKKNG